MVIKSLSSDEIGRVQGGMAVDKSLSSNSVLVIYDCAPWSKLINLSIFQLTHL